MVATCASLQTFFTTTDDLRESELRRISRVRVKSRASRTFKEA